jgi:hypothetical protein
MSKYQKIIKYLAIGFGIYLIFCITSIIIGGVIFFTSILNLVNREDVKLEKVLVDKNIKKLDIDLNKSNIILKNGNIFEIQINEDYIDYEQIGDRLLITEKRKSWFRLDSDTLIITVPDNFVFSSIVIENKTGKINISNILSDELHLDLGIGKTQIDNTKILKDVQIDGGTGEISIENGYINNLDLDIGLGKVYLESFIMGISEIDCGIGNLNLNLYGNESDYKIKLDKGIGTFKINGEKFSSKDVYGTGDNIINIDGGIGSIDLQFIKK